jgi:ABC-type nitrate/sulfonate/bicarbonate transport system permease component
MAALTLSRARSGRGLQLTFAVLGLLTLLGGWAFVAAANIVPANFFPSPWLVCERIIELLHTPFAGYLLQEHLLASLRKFGTSYGFAVLIGVPLGLAIGRFRPFKLFSLPLLEGLRFIPPIAWVPFSILWFGTGILAPAFVIFMGALFPCVLNSYRGAQMVDRSLVEAAQMLGVGRWKMLWEILLPGALPQIVAGIRIAAGFGWQSLIGAELIVGSSGLGYMIVQGESNLDAPVVLAGMVVIGVVGSLIDYLMLRLETHIKRNWNE